MDNVTVGYALGMVEGYLEGRVAQGGDGAETVLEYFKVIELAYRQKTAELAAQESKLQAIQLNLNGWRNDV